MSKKSAIQKAVDLFEGSPAKLAAAMNNGVLRQHVEHWLVSGNVPVAHCAQLEAATQGRITRRELRPDDWSRVWPELAANDAS